MARNTMAALIARVRSETGDMATPVVFTDDEIQDHLDRYRSEIRYALLTPRPVVVPLGVYAFYDYYSGLTDWEEDAILVDAGWVTRTPSTSEWLVGHWVFTGAPPGQLPPLRIVGKTYNLYLACADVCDQWATRLARQFTFMLGRQQFQRAEMATSLRESARAFRQRAPAQAGRLIVGDDLPDDSGYPSNYWETAADPLDVRYGI